MYYVYMLRCSDNSIYTGITTDLNRRLEEHISKNDKSAKYTRSHNVIGVETAWECDNKALASKLEYCIKKLNRLKKERLIENNDFSMLDSRIEKEKYKRCNNSILTDVNKKFN